MVDNVSELILFLLQADGMNDAVLTYEDEMGSSHSEATVAVRKLARINGLDHKVLAFGQVAVPIATALTLGAVSFLVMLRAV